MIAKKETIAVWFSCGAASAVAAKLTVEKYGLTHNVLIVNNPVAEEHEDNRRFLKDVEKWIGTPIIEAKSKEFPSASIIDVFEKRKYISGVHGAPCTKYLKKQARYEFEVKKRNDGFPIDWHVLGFTVDEISRHERFTTTERENVLPVLIDAKLSKDDCFKMLEKSGIELPKIYKLGYPNANCIGCVKSQSPTYWNLVRETFPEVFKQRAEQSKRIGCKLVKLKGQRVFLDELPTDAKGGKIKSYECGIFCDTK